MATGFVVGVIGDSWPACNGATVSASTGAKQPVLSRWCDGDWYAVAT